LGLVSLVLAGCGEQDLYKPPESPYEVTARAHMPTQGWDVGILGTTAFVAAGQGGLRAFDISDPSNPVMLYALNTKREADFIEVARTVLPDGNPFDVAYVTQGSEGVISFDITPGVPDSLRGPINQSSTAISANGICVELPGYLTDQHVIYLADTWKGIRVHFSDTSVPGEIRYQNFVATYGETQRLDVVDGIAYVADDEMGITVVNVRDDVRVDGMFIVDNLDTPGKARGVDAEGSYVYVADGESGFHVMRIDEQYHLSMVASIPVSGDCLDIVVQDGYAFVAAEDAGLHIIDVRNPEHPGHAGTVVTSFAQGVAVGENNVVCVADEDEGLVILQGPVPTSDNEAPAAVSDLSARLSSLTDLTLAWTAPGDDGNTGTAIDYEIRQGSAPITEANWDSAAVLVRRPVPQLAGTAQELELSNLEPDSTYYFALTTTDDALNTSALSNVAQAIMTEPVLSNGMVSPENGDVTTEFTFSVTYQDPEGDPASVATVVIDGSSFDMVPQEGDSPDYTAGVVYEYTTLLDEISHSFRFTFDDGHGPEVSTERVDDSPVIWSDPFEFNMVLVELGGGTTFSMGSPSSEPGRDADETEHSVTLTKDFYICDIEVTTGLYVTITDDIPSSFPGGRRPVHDVTWFDAVNFCNLYSVRDGYTPAYTITGEAYNDEGQLIYALIEWDQEADGYRLPTEAEWEYACRGGSVSALANGDLVYMDCTLDTNLDAIAWYCGNSEIDEVARPQDSRGKTANAYGLYDMHGNVWEWCWDFYGVYPTDSATDPTGPEDPDVLRRRVLRGGSWYYYARDCRSACRFDFPPGSADNSAGFRIVRTAPAGGK